MLDTDKTESSAEPTAHPPISSDNHRGIGAANGTKRSDEIGTLPLGERVKAVAPPLKPFKKGSFMSNPPSPSYRPEIPRKVVDIPNPSRLHTLRDDSSTGEDSNRLVVGKSISVSGDISACETLVVQGTVEANLSDAVTIEVAEGGTFKGEAEVDHAIIAGLFEGTLKARQSLEVGPSGHVKGTILYKDVSIDAGGRLQGTIDSIEANDA